MSFFASTEADFSRLVERASAVVDLAVSLPESPFKGLRGTVDFCQYDTLLSGDFEPVLHDLALVHGDTSVSLLVLDPSVNYFRNHHDLFPAFELSVGAIVGGYWDVLTHELGNSPGDALAFTSDRVVVVGSSQQWAIWGQRDWDLAVLMAPSRDRPWQLHNVPFVNEREAVEEFVVPSLFGEPFSEAQLDTFVETFSGRWR